MISISRNNPEYNAKHWLNKTGSNPLPTAGGITDVPSAAVMPRSWTPETANQWEQTGFSNGWQKKGQIVPKPPLYNMMPQPDIDYTHPDGQWRKRTPEKPVFTTMAYPENGGGKPRYDQPTTMAGYENGGGNVITLAIGENGGGTVTTLAIPENGGGTVTTLAIPENGSGTPPNDLYAPVQNPWMPNYSYGSSSKSHNC